MLYIRKLKPTLNIQLNAELHTYIIPKARGINDKISDIENYVKKFVPHKNITNWNQQHNIIINSFVIIHIRTLKLIYYLFMHISIQLTV